MEVVIEKQILTEIIGWIISKTKKIMNKKQKRLRKIKTTWEQNKRNRQRLLAIKALRAKSKKVEEGINRILGAIK